AIYSVAAGEFVEHRVVPRADLLAGDVINGPAAIEEPGTTTIIDAGDTLTVEEYGCLMIQIGGRQSDGGRSHHRRGHPRRAQRPRPPDAGPRDPNRLQTHPH